MGIHPKKIGPITQVWRTYKERKPAIFFDRDGTVIRYVKELRDPAQIHPLRSTIPALRALQNRGYLLILVTNQPIVEKGIITVSQVKKINEHLRQLFAKQGIVFDAVYTCPHRFATKCQCRKPNLAMIYAANKDFSIDMTQSWFVGDTTQDMETGRRAKLKTLLVETGNGGKDIRFFKTKGDYQAHNLQSAQSIIFKRK